MNKHVFTPSGMWLHNNIKEGLLQLKTAVDNFWDGVIVVDGMEGSGKSSLALTSAFFLDKKFNLGNVVFTPEQFYEAVDNASPGTAIVFDEFVTGGLSGDALTSITKALTKKMVMIRKKRLYIFLVIPYVFMLTKYFALARTRFLLHCTTPDGVLRGYTEIYFRSSKNLLYNIGKKTYEYNKNFDLTARFCDFFSFDTPFSEKDYDFKKEEAIRSLTEEKDEPGLLLSRYKDAFCVAVKVLFHFGGFNRSSLSEFLPFSDKVIGRCIASDVGEDVIGDLRRRSDDSLLLDGG